MENSLKAITPDATLEDNNLQNENPGGVVLHAWSHNHPTKENLVIKFRNIEIISLDTTPQI